MAPPQGLVVLHRLKWEENKIVFLRETESIGFDISYVILSKPYLMQSFCFAELI